MRQLLLLALLVAPRAWAGFVGFHDIAAPTTTATKYCADNQCGTTPQSVAFQNADPAITFDLLIVSATDATTGAPVSPGGGNSWIITIFTAGANSNSFLATTTTCLFGATDTLCSTLIPNTWVQDGGLTFEVRGSGTPRANSVLAGSVRTDGGRQVFWVGIQAPTSGTSAAIGTTNAATNVAAMWPMPENATSTRLSICCSAPPGTGNSENFRVRRTSGAIALGPNFVNTPENKSITDTAICNQDTTNTQSWIHTDLISMTITASGTPTAGLLCRAALHAGP